MIQQQEVVFNPTNQDKDTRPVFTKWKGQQMIRYHSMRATIKEILRMNQVRDVVKIGIIGEPDTGKTSQGETVAHLVHKIAEEENRKIPGLYPKYAFRSFGKEEFLDIENTLARLEPMNYVMQFKDLSFLTDKRRLDKVKQAITEIRHLKADVKIILVYDYHYTLGLDKYLRQSDVKYLTSLGSSELENTQKMFGTKYTGLILDFMKKDVEQKSKHTATFRFPGKKHFAYKYKNPFIVMLFWNGATLRYVVSPTREWIDKICPTCQIGKNFKIRSEIPIGQFCEESEKKFGQFNFKQAIKLKLFENGLNVYKKDVTRANQYLSKALEIKQISLEDLATHYNLELTRTKLRKKLDGVLAN